MGMYAVSVGYREKFIGNTVLYCTVLYRTQYASCRYKRIQRTDDSSHVSDEDLD